MSSNVYDELRVPASVPLASPPPLKLRLCIHYDTGSADARDVPYVHPPWTWVGEFIGCQVSDSLAPPKLRFSWPARQSKSSVQSTMPLGLCTSHFGCQARTVPQSASVSRQSRDGNRLGGKEKGCLTGRPARSLSRFRNEARDKEGFLANRLQPPATGAVTCGREPPFAPVRSLRRGSAQECLPVWVMNKAVRQLTITEAISGPRQFCDPKERGQLKG